MAKRVKEGRRLRLDPFSAIIPYIMVQRNDAQNHIEISFETANAEAMIRELRQEGYDSIGMLHIHRPFRLRWEYRETAFRPLKK